MMSPHFLPNVYCPSSWYLQTKAQPLQTRVARSQLRDQANSSARQRGWGADVKKSRIKRSLLCPKVQRDQMTFPACMVTAVHQRGVEALTEGSGSATC